MKRNGLTASFIIEAESANYSEGIGNITILKKMGRNDGKQYSYISRQAIRYNLMKMAGWNDTKVAAVGSGKKVVQFAPDATIKDWPEIDLFGYLKTVKQDKNKKKEDKENEKNTSKRAAVVRLSNAISMEPFNGDLDYMTNMGLASRLDNGENSIAQSEIHKSFYTYTITIDLDRVGIDGTIEINKTKRAKRVNELLDKIEFLYRDIKGRRENMSPLFAIGGVYERKNPYFENRLKFSYKNNLSIDCLKEILEDNDVKANTNIGCLSDIFTNEKNIKEKLPAVGTINNFFAKIKAEVDAYYG